MQALNPVNLTMPVIQLDAICQQIEQVGFGFVPAEQVTTWLNNASANALNGWPQFQASWDNMPRDSYMADGGRYRRRRYATMSAASASSPIVLEPHQPHYQSLDYNPLNGGVARHYEPIAQEIVLGNTMSSVLGFCQQLFGRLVPETAWHIELHQFRIEAQQGQAGRPTPEGVHRDGVNFVLVMMVKRNNISSGATTMHDLQLRKLDSFTLTAPFDCAIVNDERCMHGVTPVQQIDPAQPGYRDVLVVTFRKTG